jgi:oligoribonuclease NrnB/cAMP/cGMP phosphodiesterase (DHH superfamily)
MTQGDRPDILIYHGPNCLDGFACAWIIEGRWIGVETHVGVYGQAPPLEAIEGKSVLIADFSYDEATLRELAEVARSVTVLDHHEGSEPQVKKLLHEGIIRGEHDQKRSGAALTWEYTWGNRHYPKLVVAVQDRDLWKFEVDGTREITSVLSSYGMDMTTWTMVARAIEDPGRAQSILAEGRAIMRQRDTDLEAVLNAGTRLMVIGGMSVPVCNAPYFWASEIGGRLAEMAPFGATYMDLADGRRQFSLRSRGEVNVNEIAQTYGGGGHPGAAGFTAAPGWEGDEAETDAIALAAAGGVKVGA